MLGEKSAHKGREARLSSLKTLYWGGGSPGIGAADKKRRKNLHALDTGEAQIVRIGNIPSLEWFQAISNGKSRLVPLR